MAFLWDPSDSIDREFLRPVEIAHVPRRPAIGSPREQRDAAVREAFLVSGKTFEEAKNVVAQAARRQPSGVATVGATHRAHPSRHAEEAVAYNPAEAVAPAASKLPHGESNPIMKPRRDAAINRPGKRVLKPADLPFEDGIHNLRLRASQAARDLNLVKSGKVRTTHLTMLPREMEVGGLAIDAAAGASSLYQAVALSVRQSSPNRSTNGSRGPGSPTSSEQGLNVDVGALFAARRGSASDGVIQAFEVAANSAVAKSVGDKPLGLSPLKASRQAWNALHHPALQAVQQSASPVNTGSVSAVMATAHISKPAIMSPHKPSGKPTAPFKQREATSTSVVISRVVRRQLEQHNPSSQVSPQTGPAEHKSAHSPPASSTALAMATLNSRLGGTGAETAISDLVALQRDMSAIQFALATFGHLRDGGIGLDLGVLAPIPPSSMDEIKRKAAAATSAADQQQSSSKISASTPVKPPAALRPALTQVKSFHLGAATLDDTKNVACGVANTDEGQPLCKSNSKGFSLRALRAGLVPQEHISPAKIDQEAHHALPRPFVGASAGLSSITLSSKVLRADSEEIADARLALHMSTPDPIPYLPYTSRYEEVAPVVWPSLSTIRQEFEADLVAKATRLSGGVRNRIHNASLLMKARARRLSEDGGHVKFSQGAQPSPSHSEFRRFVLNPVLERGADSDVPVVHLDLGSRTARASVSKGTQRVMRSVSIDHNPTSDNSAGLRHSLPQTRQQTPANILASYTDLGALAPKLSGLTFYSAAKSQHHALGMGDVYDLTRLAHDRRLQIKLDAIDHDRAFTLLLKSAVLERLLDKVAVQQCDVPEDDLRFMRFDAEMSRVIKEHSRANEAMEWYRQLLLEIVKRQSELSIHPAERLVLKRVQEQLKEGRDINLVFLSELLQELSVHDPLHPSLLKANFDPQKAGALLTSAAMAAAQAATSPFGSIMTAVATVHTFIDKLRARTNRARDAGKRRLSSAASPPVKEPLPECSTPSLLSTDELTPIGRSTSMLLFPTTAGTAQAAHTYTSMQLLQLQQNSNNPILLQHPGVQGVLAFVRRIAGISLFDWDKLHADLGLLPHAAPIEVIVQKCFYERVKLATMASQGASANDEVLAKMLVAPAGTAVYTGGVLSNIVAAQPSEAQSPSDQASTKSWRVLLHEQEAQQRDAMMQRRLDMDEDGAAVSPSRPQHRLSVADRLPARMYSFFTDAIAAEVAKKATVDFADSSASAAAQERAKRSSIASPVENTAEAVASWRQNLEVSAALAVQCIDGSKDPAPPTSTPPGVVPYYGHLAGGRRLSVGPYSFSVTEA